MAHRSLIGGMARPCASQSAALVGLQPRAAPASPPSATLNMAMFALSTRWRAVACRVVTRAPRRPRPRRRDPGARGEAGLLLPRLRRERPGVHH
jgi:hypothetical protein